MSERSKRDTIRGNTIENQDFFCLFVYMCVDVRMYFDIFSVRSQVDPVPNFTEQNPLVC